MSQSAFSYAGPPSICNGLSSDALPLFNRLQSEHSPKYIIYTINPTTKIISVLKSSPTRDYAAFLSDLPEKECRFGVYSFGDDQNSTIFVTWVPEGADAKDRELFGKCAVELWREMLGLKPTGRVEVREKSALAEEVVRKRVGL
ncbi:cofilin [Arthrobotrys musiformis]|uniref:Cofilin n=1 Tax=Arthrobotrys musiformis TaxID=47236 RepID=A0AAV9VRS7_9PEZI